VDPGTPEVFAQRLQVLLDDPEMRDRMSSAAYRRATLFPWNAAAGEVVSAYQQVMASTGHISTAVPCFG